MNITLKTCTKCKQQFLATLEFFYKNAGGKYGVTPRCKPCVNEDNEISHQARLLRDPEKIREQANERSKKHYHTNLEKSREIARKSAAKARKDPEKYLKIQARKRAGGAGLSVEALEGLFQKQGCKCAICGTQEPQGLTGANGWNVDHCHKTDKVRFILCNHCNRGLGAFRDTPEFMRKAADLLEEFQNDNKQTVSA